MFKYTICNNSNTDTHIICTIRFTITLRFYALKYWKLMFSAFSDNNVKVLYLPMLDISVNNNV